LVVQPQSCYNLQSVAVPGLPGGGGGGHRAQTFRDPNVVVVVIVWALLMLVVLRVVGSELGKRVDQ
jgi:ABC-type methionine transport system permease subunit